VPHRPPCGSTELTFISSRPHIPIAAPDPAAYGLVKVVPRVDPGRESNAIWVLPEVRDVLSGSDLSLGFPDRAADVLTTNIIAGYFCTVSLSGDPSKEPQLERLEGLDEAWAICVRTPPPGWRLFGRFYARSFFVGVRIYDRHVLGIWENYNRLASEALAECERLLPGIEPLRANSVSAYLEGLARDVDSASRPF
jgi:hypothetical protein